MHNPPRWRPALEVGLIFLVFFIHGASLAPDVNEAHYLSKARHYWDPSWCAHDFFCGTADAHQVFYWTFGWLTLWLPLPAVAWCGRVLTWGLLAWAWRRLGDALSLGPLGTVLSAALFVALNGMSQMAGEWIVGGVEAKGFAYVLVLLGLEALVRGRWSRSLLLCGAAASFHVIIGGWSLVAIGVTWLANSDRPPLARLLLPAFGAVLLALPGLVPALSLTWHVDPQIVDEANWIYVFDRLYHHLWPQSFPRSAIVSHVALVAVLVLLAWWAPNEGRWRRLRGFVATAVGLAAIGLAIDQLTPYEPELTARLLRYYWFRLADVMVPLGVALLFVRLLCEWRTARPIGFAVGAGAAILLSAGHLGEMTWRRHEQPWPPADAQIANLAAWREVCQWAASETPPDAVFLVPRLAQTFRWYSGRAEVANRKDIPQDAQGIVEWWRRMNRIYGSDPPTAERWHNSLAELGAARLIELGTEFGAGYVITAPYPVLNLERVGPANPSYVVYRLPGATRP